MKPNELHDFLFNIYSYADYLANQIQPGNTENNILFVNLIYLESLMDSMGRVYVFQAAQAAGLDANKELNRAHHQLDTLRQRMHELWQQNDFDQSVQEVADKIRRDWLRDKSSL